MSTPRLLRPMLLLGFIVLSLAVFSYMSLPDGSASPARLVVLAVSAGSGLLAIGYDLIRMWREFKDRPQDKS